MRPPEEIRAEFEGDIRREAAEVRIPDDDVPRVLSREPSDRYTNNDLNRRWRGYLNGYRAAEKRFAEWVEQISQPSWDDERLRFVEVQMDRDAYQAMMKEFGR